MVTRPSISGIMMSISTMSICGSAATMADGLAAVVGPDDVHAVLFQHGGQREDVAHVVVDDQHLLAGQRPAGLVHARRGRCAAPRDMRAGIAGAARAAPWSSSRGRPTGPRGAARTPSPGARPVVRRSPARHVQHHGQRRGPPGASMRARRTSSKPLGRAASISAAIHAVSAPRGGLAASATSHASRRRSSSCSRQRRARRATPCISDQQCAGPRDT